MPVEAVRHEILVVPPPAALVHFGVERGEEQILQDGLVENGFLIARLCWLEAGQDLGELTLIEKRVRDETLFLNEPAEDQARDKADDADMVVTVRFFGRVL